MTAAATTNTPKPPAGGVLPLDDAASDVGGMPRARQRPDGVTAPAHWTTPAVPTPADVARLPAGEQPEGRDPVRYGDWEKNGLAIDF